MWVVRSNDSEWYMGENPNGTIQYVSDVKDAIKFELWEEANACCHHGYEKAVPYEEGVLCS